MKRIITIISFGASIGLIGGLIASFFYGFVHRYHVHKLFYLIAVSTGKVILHHVFFFTFLLLLLYLFWLVSTKIFGCSEEKVARREALIFLILIILAVLNIVWQSIGIYSLALLPLDLIRGLKNFFMGRLAWRHYLSRLTPRNLFLTGATLAVALLLLKYLTQPTARLFLRLNKLKLKREKFLWVIAVIAGAIIVTLNCFCFFFPGKSHPDHPSVILIICDTLRADHLGIYGYQRPQPNIEALARHSTLFSNAYTQAPATCPSMWNILTSRYKSAIPAKNADVTIAEYLKNKGYRTGAFISQHLLEGQRANLHHGFDLYDSWSPQDHHLLSRRRAASVTKAALKWIDKQRDKPFFAWVVYFDPHHPYIPPPEFRGYYNPENAGFSGDRREKGIHLQVGPGAVSDEYKTFLINAYDEEINYVDHQLGRLLSSLKSSGLYDRTMIILTADHGEELGDNENRWDHCMLLSQEEIWVPLLIKLPNQQQRSTVTKAVQTIDIYPTIIDYLERRNDLEFQDEMEGRSLLPFLTGEKPSEDHYAASFWRQQQCVVEDDLKYQVTGEKERLTNIKTGEEAENPEARRRLKERLRRLWEKNPERDISYQKEISKLQALGYIN